LVIATTSAATLLLTHSSPKPSPAQQTTVKEVRPFR
jgi:hypothetical protein